MKNTYFIAFVIFTVFLINGCYISISENMDKSMLSKVSNHDLYEFYVSNDNERITGFRQICEWMNENLEYIIDSDGDVWDNPEKTLQRMGGDCDDFAILFINIAYFEFGIKCNLIAVHSDNVEMTTNTIYNRNKPNFKIVDGGFINHGLVEYNGKYYDPMVGEVSCDSVGYMYTFDEIFNY